MNTRATYKAIERRYEHLRAYWKLITEKGYEPERALGDPFSERASALRALGVTLSGEDLDTIADTELKQAFEHYITHNFIPLDHLRVYFRCLKKCRKHCEALGHKQSLRYRVLRNMVLHPTDDVRLRVDFCILLSNWVRRGRRNATITPRCNLDCCKILENEKY
jgi:hypothetical protein